MALKRSCTEFLRMNVKEEGREGGREGGKWKIIYNDVKKQCQKAKNTQNQTTSPSKDDHSSTSTMEQGLMENERIPVTESHFKEWIIRNFCELKEHVVAQRKETKNFEKKV